MAIWCNLDYNVRFRAYLIFVMSCTPYGTAFRGQEIVHRKVHKFSTKIVSPKNSVNQHLRAFGSWEDVFSILDGIIGIMMVSLLLGQCIWYSHSTGVPQSKKLLLHSLNFTQSSSFCVCGLEEKKYTNSLGAAGDKYLLCVQPAARIHWINLSSLFMTAKTFLMRNRQRGDVAINYKI